MTLRQFFLNYLWPLETCSVSRSVAKTRSQVQSTPAKGLRLNLRLELRSDLQVYAKRWFVLSLGLFVLAWASSFVLTVLGFGAGLVGLGLFGTRRYLNRKDAGDSAEDTLETAARRPQDSL